MTLDELARSADYLGIDDLRIKGVPAEDKRDRVWTVTAQRGDEFIHNTDTTLKSAVIGLLNDASARLRAERDKARPQAESVASRGKR